MSRILIVCLVLGTWSPADATEATKPSPKQSE